MTDLASMSTLAIVDELIRRGYGDELVRQNGLDDVDEVRRYAIAADEDGRRPGLIFILPDPKDEGTR